MYDGLEEERKTPKQRGQRHEGVTWESVCMVRISKRASERQGAQSGARCLDSIHHGSRGSWEQR